MHTERGGARGGFTLCTLQVLRTHMKPFSRTLYDFSEESKKNKKSNCSKSFPFPRNSSAAGMGQQQGSTRGTADAQYLRERTTTLWLVQHPHHPQTDWDERNMKTAGIAIYSQCHNITPMYDTSQRQ